MVLSRYERLQVIRSSLFGEILLCLDTETKQKVVMKTVDVALALKKCSRQHEIVNEDVFLEIDVMNHLRALGGHENVIQMQDCLISEDNQLQIVLDYCDGGDLLESCVHQAEEQEEILSPASSASSATSSSSSASSSSTLAAPAEQEKQMMQYFKDVLAGLHFLHSNGIAHRDLSLENILLRQGRAVISDFGLCVFEGKNPNAKLQSNDIVGKHYYMAPEVIGEKGDYDARRADLWSLGVTLFILLTKSPPFEKALESDPGFRYLKRHGVKKILSAWEMEKTISPEVQDLLEKLLVIDPEERISWQDIWQHPAVVLHSI